MPPSELIVGVLHPPPAAEVAELAARCRDFTISCDRFDFFGPLLEAEAVDELLERAARTDAAWCLVQSAGHVTIRHRNAETGAVETFFEALDRWRAEGEDFLGGWISHDPEGGYGLDELCFAVDLGVYRDLGRPPFGASQPGPRRLPAVVEEAVGHDGARTLRTGTGEIMVETTRPGWNLMAAGLRRGLTVRSFDGELERCGLDLRPRSPEDVEVLRTYRGEGIFDDAALGRDGRVGGDWRRFLDFVKNQAKHARRGVFLGNWEGYRDIEEPPPDWCAPATAFYGVAAGFKPNRILATHGFGEGTRVSFFDYSPVALGLRRALVEEWDGTDFPAFVEAFAGRFPDAFYQLWGNARPGALDLELVAALWRRELDRWGGKAAFREHWRRYRALPHRYLLCDLLADPRPLLDAVAIDTGAADGSAAATDGNERSIFWWSNAFHSLHSVWFYSLEERRQRYDRWLQELTGIASSALLYGAAVDNLDLGGCRLAEHRASRSGEPS